MSEVIVYGQGLVYLSVCAPNSMSREEIEAEVNSQEPTGISSQWRISPEPTFFGGETNPCPCNTHLDSRQHWLLSC